MDDEPNEAWPKIDLERPLNRELMVELDAAERLVAPAVAKYEALQRAADEAKREMFALESRLDRTIRAVAGINDCAATWNGNYDRERTTGYVQRALAEWRATPALNGGKAAS